MMMDSAGRPLTISVVIPTRNRRGSLARTLAALVRQTRAPEEVLVMDASDQPLDGAAMRSAHPGLPITCLRAPAGVCSQRNLGIRSARESHVLLLDDDIEAPGDYLERLAGHLDEHPSEGAVTGVLCEPDGSGATTREFSVPTVRYLVFAFLFQLTVWSDVEAVRGSRVIAVPLAAIKRWYRRRGNGWSLAGWPLVTQPRGTVIHTAIYALGAALVRRDWLLASPYEERLGAHGIGDNYGVALGFPADRGVAVLTDLPVLHYRATDNRLDPVEAYYQRVLALDYFVRTNARFSRVHSAWLAWSLVGNTVAFALRNRWDLVGRTVRALGIVLTSRNPLLASGGHGG